MPSAPSEQFVQLLMQHRHGLFAYLMKQLGNAQDAEDVFQRTSIVLWKKMDQFDRDASFFHWACGIAFNEVRNFRATSRRDRLHFDDELVGLLATESIEDNDASVRQLGALRQCMAKLPARQQELVRRCYLGSDSITKVAAESNRQRTAVYKQLARLKSKLRDCIDQRLAQSLASHGTNPITSNDPPSPELT